MDAPRRVVCLTAETAETAFAVGAGDRVVGVSAFATRPAEARTRAKVGAFSTADVPAILALEPDLVLAFSDVQRDVVRDLLAEGATVLATNQRTLAQTYAAIRLVGRALGCAEGGARVAAELEARVEEARREGASLERRPRVYFEEWDAPLVAGVGWVGELIEAAGGEDVFADLRGRRRAAERVVAPEEVVARDPEVVFASWCGKPFRPEALRARPGWDRVRAVRHGAVFEIPGEDVLAPGPSLARGLAGMQRILRGRVAAPSVAR
ncbi:MAG TPA: cobalamin-binding protein [Candidatus Thermoplasmatota archaeon]|nr:cobalamin-binding protein [Candidatus Thermoplasmatota archaeon]